MFFSFERIRTDRQLSGGVETMIYGPTSLFRLGLHLHSKMPHNLTCFRWCQQSTIRLNARDLAGQSMPYHIQANLTFAKRQDLNLFEREYFGTTNDLTDDGRLIRELVEH